ncbi:MAG: Na+/H+ antiporter NhaC family protein [Clostridia bacterium]|jgi:tetracycline resistance efflux pump|nr:Na+/H+ antiporter NhaC family protein [Clostridia bacterium]
MEAAATYGVISLIPIAVVIIMALITKKTFEPLLTATLVAIIIYAKGDFFNEFVNGALAVMADPTIGWVILVCGFMGSLLLILEKSNASIAFANLLEKFATTRKKALFCTWLFGIFLFIDDYLNVLTVGNTMKKVTDKFKISRAMLAYSVGSTAAPIVVLVPISTWAIFFASLLKNEGIVGADGSAITAYIHCIPYLFYGWIAVFIVMPLVILGIIPLMGPMKKQELNARETGDLFPPGVRPPVKEETVLDPSVKQGGIWDFILPLLVLVGVTLAVGNDVLKGIIVALFFTAILYVGKKLTDFTTFLDNFWSGFATMVQIFGLLVLAFMFKNACAALGFTDYVIASVAPYMDGGLLPAVVFVATALMAFAMANFWGLAAIVVPIVIPLATAMNVDIYLASAAVFSGATFGSHACFYADSAILIGNATDIRPYDHAITQLPYAIIAAILTTILYLILGFKI